MTNSSRVLQVGTRSSKLALLQAKQVTEYFHSLVPEYNFDIVSLSSPGDRDQNMDLRTSPSDFFTKDLDEAIANRKIDAAVHSAKDLPEKISEDLDWCWLPIREDPRDVIVYSNGVNRDTIPLQPRIGISSDRREAWCKKRFPNAILLPIRGTIEKRLEQLDNGMFDAVVMASAALIRLGLKDRISEYIDPDDLEVPEGQGVLALTFRSGDPFWTILRKLFVKPVTFAGAGCGRTGTCTIETIDTLKTTEVCIYDALMDKALLDFLPAKSLKIDAGKRMNEHTIVQDQINSLIVDYSRRGFKVTRLKGGDPGIFGRLAEEIETLDKLQLPYQVYPGISSLQCATTGTGILLTRRGLSRGFTVVTPRSAGGKISAVDSETRSSLPQVYFMSRSSIREISKQLIDDGTHADTGAAIVFGAGTYEEKVIRSTLKNIADLADSIETDLPAIVIVGDVTKFSYQKHGALNGLKVLVTCSAALQKVAINSIENAGGIAIPYPAIFLDTCSDGLDDLTGSTHFDFLILTSPSAVHSMMSLLSQRKMDIRCLPPVVVCGKGTANALAAYNLYPVLIPDQNFSADGLINAIVPILNKNQSVLRLRSDKAGDHLSEEIKKKTGANVIDRIICNNQSIHSGPVPEFDAIYFASTSAVTSICDRQDPIDITDKLIVSIGKPTTQALIQRGFKNIISGPEALTDSAIQALSISLIQIELRNLFSKR